MKDFSLLDYQMEKKYILVGGKVQSLFDGEVHYIGPRELLRLYSLNEKECYLLPSDYLLHLYDADRFMVLRPRRDGRYYLMEEE